MADPIAFKDIAGPLTVTLGLSLAVERVLEFVKNVLEPLLGYQAGRKAPGLGEPGEILTRLEDLAERDRAEADTELDERHTNATILVEDATDPDDGWATKGFILQALGLAIGIVAARIAGVQLFHALLRYPIIKDSVVVSDIPAWVDFTLTGLLIGGGSGPIHVLLRFVTQRKLDMEAQPVTPAPAPVTPTEVQRLRAPAVIVSATPAAKGWVPIPYDGGVARELLESTHRRRGNPTRVVYHHTAMNSASTFEDVVRVITSREDSKTHKKWITGYHCVILADGSIHPFCRWDRYGNHALGHNTDSLGISFNGNFETDPKVPFSNPNGRLGPPRPTDAQLEAGARVVALWTFLYTIPLDFATTIIPHRQIASKTCPGGMFPYDEFKRLVEFYSRAWKAPEVQEQIAAFKLKSYLYVT